MLTTTSADDGKENSVESLTAQVSQSQKQKQVKWGITKVRKNHGLRNLFR